MNTKDLGGHSGCRILLCTDERGAHFVRKISPDKEYNIRLEKQCTIQSVYYNDFVTAPKVLDRGYTSDGLFYFDMEYIRGITLSQYIRTSSVSDIRSIVEWIVRANGCTGVAGGEKAKLAFLKKIASVKENLQGIHWNKTVDMCFKTLEKANWSNVPMSSCHGDLTLENIIIAGDNLYYIDFLDSFYDSWVLDFGKLLQDVQTMWSYRYEPRVDTNTLIRLHIFRDILITIVPKSTPDSIELIYNALLLHLARIYPYAKDRKTIEYLDEKVALTIRAIMAVSDGKYISTTR